MIIVQNCRLCMGVCEIKKNKLLVELQYKYYSYYLLITNIIRFIFK